MAPRPLLQTLPPQPKHTAMAPCNGTVHSANGTTSTPPKLVVTLPPTIQWPHTWKNKACHKGATYTDWQEFESCTTLTGVVDTGCYCSHYNRSILTDLWTKSHRCCLRLRADGASCGSSRPNATRGSLRRVSAWQLRAKCHGLFPFQKPNPKCHDIRSWWEKIGNRPLSIVTDHLHTQPQHCCQGAAQPATRPAWKSKKLLDENTSCCTQVPYVAKIPV